MTITTIIFAAAPLLAGVIFGYFLRKQIVKARIANAEQKAESLIEEAKKKEKEIIHEAKEKSFSIIENAKREEEESRKELFNIQKRQEKREAIFDKKILDLEAKNQQVTEKSQKLDTFKEEIQNIKKEQLEKLQKIAELNKEDAKNVLLNNVEKEIKEDLIHRIKKVQDETSEAVNREAKKVLTTVIMRCAASQVAEVSTTTLHLASDEMKGRIIGKEGRNIRTLEQLTGVEIIIDDTPELITISGFNPIRRQLAKKALEQLLLDGRIHPTRIEEAIENAKKELALDIKKAGEEAAYQAGVAGLDPKLLQILGRLKYRTSYSQNVLQHSIEVAHLSAMLASELGADPHIAKKGGLLHDIGKALDHEIPGSHTEIGRDIAKKFNLPPEIIAPIYEHHNDIPSTPEAMIVKIADAISASRPGARNVSYEEYLQRLEELEDLAMTFPGVDKAYAIQAGREVRVFVNPDKLDDIESFKLAKNIAGKIEEQLKYPGEIKVNVIRERRVIEYAR
ncbi:MAG: ribonuclease Y [Parcubacteria group bacterium]|nr:ribonuclease Y [Parcubacteria group bacterium]